jgi:hypothetical protein
LVQRRRKKPRTFAFFLFFYTNKYWDDYSSRISVGPASRTGTLSRDEKSSLPPSICVSIKSNGRNLRANGTQIVSNPENKKLPTAVERWETHTQPNNDYLPLWGSFQERENNHRRVIDTHSHCWNK